MTELAESLVDEWTEETTAADSQLIYELSIDSIGRWNRLISRTNWEKGDVIHRWRSHLKEAGLPNSAYSDESWSRRVGNVSPQHVGRLRRVFERFGTGGEQYPSLYWSHFQAALDWDDAEKWLEEANANQWSVAIMRNKRWETLGAPADMKPKDKDIILAEFDEDVSPANDSQTILEGSESRIEPVEKSRKSPGDSDLDDIPFDLDDKPDTADTAKGKKTTETEETELLSTGEILMKLSNMLKTLPDDLSDAFEQLKVAILSHKLSGWKEVDQQHVLTCLDLMRTVVPAKEDQ